MPTAIELRVKLKAESLKLRNAAFAFYLIAAAIGFVNAA